jgi:hypothetical protein
LPRSSAVRFSHFLPGTAVAARGVGGCVRQRPQRVFSRRCSTCLPTLVLLLGGAYCAVYRRQRVLGSDAHGVHRLLLCSIPRPTITATTARCAKTPRWSFTSCVMLLPLLFGLFAAWQERTHLFQDMVARFAVLLAFGSVALGLEQSYPQALLIWLSEIRWPALHGAVDEPDPAVLSGVYLGVRAAGLAILAQSAPAARGATGRPARRVLDAAENLHPAVYPEHHVPAR